MALLPRVTGAAVGEEGEKIRPGEFVGRVFVVHFEACKGASSHTVSHMVCSVYEY